MEAMIKKISLALGLLGLSASAAYAGHVEELLPVAPPTVCVTIPQQAGSWVFGGELLYWAAANGDLHYGSTLASELESTTAPVNTIDFRRTHVVEPDYDIGYHIDVGYNFEGDGRYVQLGWTHLDANEASSRLRDGVEFLSGPAVMNLIRPVETVVGGTGNNPLDMPVPFLPYGLNATTGPNFDGHEGWDSIRGSSSNDYDAIDFVFGQRFDFNQKVTLAAFGGLRYADIENRDTVNARVRDEAATTGVSAAAGRVHMESDYWGIGPRAGFNAQVRLGGGASIVGTFAGSLLVGEADQKQNIDVTYFLFGSTNQVDSEEHNRLKIADQTRVVPELDARIGVNYTFAWNTSSAFGIELGYHVENYFDVKDNSQFSYYDTMSHNNDFALYGPYLRLQAEIA